MRESTILEYMPLANSIAYRINERLPNIIDVQEIISAGHLGLIDAIDKFDPKKDCSLKTYATIRIRGAITDYLRSIDPYTRGMREKISSIGKATHSIESRTGKEASIDEICEEMGITYEKYQRMKTDIHFATIINMDEFISPMMSINQVYAGSRFEQSLASNDDQSIEFDTKERRKEIEKRLLINLSEREFKIIKLYHWKGKTLKEIGIYLDVTESRVSQIVTEIYKKLKNKLEDV